MAISVEEFLTQISGRSFDKYEKSIKKYNDDIVSLLKEGVSIKLIREYLKVNNFNTTYSKLINYIKYKFEFEYIEGRSIAKIKDIYSKDNKKSLSIQDVLLAKDTVDSDKFSELLNKVIFDSIPINSISTTRKIYNYNFKDFLIQINVNSEHFEILSLIINMNLYKKNIDYISIAMSTININNPYSNLDYTTCVEICKGYDDILNGLCEKLYNDNIPDVVEEISRVNKLFNKNIF